MTTHNTNEYVVEWMNDVPAGSAVACYSVTDVENYFGVRSVEASEAKTFFAQHPGSTMYFGRDPIGQRPHELGANLAGLSLAQLRAINGTVSLTYDGYTYAGVVNLSNVSGTSYDAVNMAAHDLAQALNSRRGVVAQGTASFVQHTVTFEAKLDAAQMTVTKINSGGPLVLQGTITGPGIGSPGTNSILIHDHGANGGVGNYSLFHSSRQNGASGTYTETYDVMTITSLWSGALQSGLQVHGNGVVGLAPSTGIVNVPGTGTGVGSQWITNNAPAISGQIDVTFQPPLIGVYEDRSEGVIIGRTMNNELLDISTQGEFGGDFISSDPMSYLTGSAAAALGFGPGIGDAPSAGGVKESVAKYMTQATTELTTTGQPMNYSLIASNETQKFNAAIFAWTQTKAGQGYTFVGTVPPANVTAAHDLLSGSASFSEKPSDARGYAETAILAGSPH